MKAFVVAVAGLLLMASTAVAGEGFTGVELEGWRLPESAVLHDTPEAALKGAPPPPARCHVPPQGMICMPGYVVIQEVVEGPDETASVKFIFEDWLAPADRHCRDRGEPDYAVSCNDPRAVATQRYIERCYRRVEAGVRGPRICERQEATPPFQRSRP